MWRFWARGFLILTIFSSFAFGEDFEKICNEEIAKEDFNITIVQNSCQKAGENEIKNKNFINASWYLLLAGDFNKIIYKLKPHIKSNLSNIAHCYVLLGKPNQAKKYYKKFLYNYYNPNKSIENDYILLLKIYPEQKNQLKQGLKIWSSLYKPLNPIHKLYQEYHKYKIDKYYSNAIKILNKIIEIKKDKLTPHCLSIATDYNNLALLYQEKNDFSNNLKYLQKALSITKNELGTNDINVAYIYSNLSSTIYNNIGDYNQSLTYQLKALSIFKNKLTSDNQRLSVLYNNLGYTYGQIKNYTQALNYYFKSIKINKQNNYPIAVEYNNISMIYSDLNDYSNALKYAFIAFEIHKENKNDLNISVLYKNIGLIYKKKGDFDTSLKYLFKSLEIKEKKFKKNDLDIATLYAHIAQIETLNKNYLEGYLYMQSYTNIFNKTKNNIFHILSQKEKIFFLNKINNIEHLLGINFLYSKSLNNEKMTKKVFIETLSFWLNYKGTLFEYQNILSMLKNNPKTQKETRENIKKLNISNILLSRLNNQYTRDKNRIIKVEEEIHNLEVILSKDNLLFKHLLDLNDIDSIQIASRLKENQLYIDFARATNNYYIFTLNHENTITFQQIDENDTKKIDNGIKAFQHKMQEMANLTKENRLTKTVLEKSKKESQKILQKLYTSIIKNYLKKIIKTKHHLIISPDGLLNFLPFEALYNQKNYLIEKYQVSYISSGKELLRQSNNRKNNNSSEVIIFGSPDFWFQNQKSSLTKSSITKENATIFDIKFSPLNISKKEIEVMKSYYPKLKIYTDSNATVENLFKIKNPKILHISTHGFFLNNKNNPNPMLASGLAFAGANYANFKDDARGIATALQLSGLELQNTELVVLSACESGLGKVYNAEGVTGLSKAFIQAGAKKVMSSLWKISSRETVTIIDNFYANIHAENNYTTALRKAKLQMISLHPYYWSAFIMSGI